MSLNDLTSSLKELFCSSVTKYDLISVTVGNLLRFSEKSLTIVKILAIALFLK